jgi:hypothetical protein
MGKKMVLLTLLFTIAVSGFTGLYALPGTGTGGLATQISGQ